MTPSHHSPAPEQAHNGETLIDAGAAPLARPSREPGGCGHLSLMAAEQAMRGALAGQKGEHLASCPRCQRLVQDMQPSAAEAERFARWAAQLDSDLTTKRAKSRRPAKRLILSTPRTALPKLPR